MIQGDACQWLAGETRQWDLILTNPPYVDAADMQTLPEEYRHEPNLTRRRRRRACLVMLAGTGRAPKPNGVFLCEVGASAPAMQRKYPDLPIHWLKLSEGGEGVFMHLESESRANHAASHFTLQRNKIVQITFHLMPDAFKPDNGHRPILAPKA